MQLSVCSMQSQVRTYDIQHQIIISPHMHRYPDKKSDVPLSSKNDTQEKQVIQHRLLFFSNSLHCTLFHYPIQLLHVALLHQILANLLVYKFR